MTESQEPKPGGARYSRTSGGLIGAMIVTVLAVLAFVGFRALTTDHDPTPVQTVDYVAVAKASRSDGKLKILVPEPLPSGWKATSATYTRGASPAWHLGMLTTSGRYVGVEEAAASVQDLATEHVDPDAKPGKDVTIGGETWQTFTDAGGDYAVARSGTACDDDVDSVLVVGTAPEKQIRELAGSLEGEISCAK